ncbi:MAG TPA: hypothetical protein VIL79_06955 [Thermoleophilia bacterium]
MDTELFAQATYPAAKYPEGAPWPEGERSVQTTGGAELLRRLSAGACERALGVLTTALLRADALEFADALEGVPLQRAKAEAAEPEAAAVAAKKALAKEEDSTIARLAAYFKSKVAGTLSPGEGEPARESEKVRQLKTAVAAAEQEAAPFSRRVHYHEAQIAALRAAPKADPATLAVIAEALVGGHCDPD